MEIVILTGISGAGKTAAINICQDNDYYTIDNLPPKLIIDYLNSTSKSKQEKFAFVVDIRLGEHLSDIVETVEILRKDHQVKVIFLDAENNELIKRFQEKRRPHFYKNLTLEDAIDKERKQLKTARNLADFYIDTTGNSIPQLTNRLLDILEVSENANIQIISFGFKYGMLKEVDYLFDVRFIDNPYYIESLKHLSGKTPEIQEFVKKFDETHDFVNKVVDLIEFLVPNFNRLGKNNIVIGIGCTGGKHRSVVISEMIHERLKAKYSASVFHREKNLW